MSTEISLWQALRLRWKRLKEDIADGTVFLFPVLIGVGTFFLFLIFILVLAIVTKP